MALKYSDVRDMFGILKHLVEFDNVIFACRKASKERSNTYIWVCCLIFSFIVLLNSLL